MIHEKKYVFCWTSEKGKRKKRKNSISLWEKILKWRKDKPEIRRKYLQNIWLNTLLQRTQRTLKSPTKWKQTTQLRNGQILWKDTSWKYSWKIGTEKDAKHHISLQRSLYRHTRRCHYTPVPRRLQPLLFIASSNTKWYKFNEGFVIFFGTWPTNLKTHDFTKVCVYT